jgi:DNA-binding protein HU-beta
MNKVDCVSIVAARSGLTLKEANAALSAAFEAIGQALERGEAVSLHGFGSFEPRDRQRRNVLHPRTQEPLELPPTRTVIFKPAAALRKRLFADKNSAL